MNPLRLHRNSSEEAAETLSSRASHEMGDCGDRAVVSVCGRVRSMTLRPRAGSPSLEADLYDDSGTVTLVWLGRRSITGLRPGRAVKASGRVCLVDGRKTLFNPRYELLAEAD